MIDYLYTNTTEIGSKWDGSTNFLFYNFKSWISTRLLCVPKQIKFSKINIDVKIFY